VYKNPFFIIQNFYAKSKIDTLLRKTISIPSFFWKGNAENHEQAEIESESKE
jgi:hypothetical protein